MNKAISVEVTLIMTDSQLIDNVASTSGIKTKDNLIIAS